MKTKLFFAALAMMAVVSFTMAQDTKPQRKGEPAKTAFVDANNDGICDNAGTGACAMGERKNQKGKGLRNGEGLRKGKGNGMGMGMGAGACCAPAKAGQNGKAK